MGSRVHSPIFNLDLAKYVGKEDKASIAMNLRPEYASIEKLRGTTLTVVDQVGKTHQQLSFGKVGFRLGLNQLLSHATETVHLMLMLFHVTYCLLRS